MSARPLHPMSPRPDFEEQARLDFAVALKTMLRGRSRAALRNAYDRRAAPAWTAARGRPPQDWREIEAAMTPEPIYRWWSALSRAQQEYYVDVTATVCDRQLPELIERFCRYAAAPVHGTLTLDPALPLPHYQRDVDSHCVPGSYFLERAEDDVWAGARSDLGSFVFSMGRHGGFNDDKGVSGAAFVKARYPDLRPARILDLGCTVGLSTLPYHEAFPDAQLHAIDLSAPSLRYGHARAEALGVPVHFVQANAEHTPFQDAGFDLVLSHILLHETSRDAVAAIFAECHRLLRPGGVMLHVEVPIRHQDAYDQFLTNWDGKNNNEPFWPALAEMDLIAPAVRAGFAAESVFEAVVPSLAGKQDDWLGIGARK